MTASSSIALLLLLLLPTLLLLVVRSTSICSSHLHPDAGDRAYRAVAGCDASLAASVTLVPLLHHRILDHGTVAVAE